MNPTLQPSVLQQARKLDEEKFCREFLAQFTDQIATWVVPEVLESCVVRGRTELPRVENAARVATIDAAFRGDDFALAVLHKTADGPIVVDRVARWAGTKKAPLGFEWVCEEIARIVKEYGIREVMGDQYCAPVIKQHFDKLGIRYHEFTFVAHTRVDLFGNLRHLLVQRKIELLDEPVLLRELRALEEQHKSNGDIDIRPSYSQKDDVAVAVALGAFELAKRRKQRELWAEFVPILRRQSALGGSLERGWTRIGY